MTPSVLPEVAATILIVDDMPENLQLLGGMLSALLHKYGHVFFRRLWPRFFRAEQLGRDE